jgi:CRISPR-associated protein Csa3
MKKVVHIIPVGHTKVTLIEGMRQFPFHKVVLVLGKEDGPGERKAVEVAKEIEDEIGSLAEVEFLYIDADNVYSTAIDLAREIKNKQKEGDEVKVNASGSLRTVGISCYLACAVTGAELYVAHPAYENGKVIGIRRVVDIPSFPLKKVGKEELSILSLLKEKGATESVDELIEGLLKINKGADGYQNERARMSYHIKKLKNEGFIETKKIGKSLRISLSSLGKLYTIGKA